MVAALKPSCSHESLKSPALWRNLPYVGIQRDPEGDLEIRNCPDCASSLSIPLPRLLRITCVAPCLYLVEHTGGRAVLREVDERFGSTLAPASCADEIRHEAHDPLDADLFLTACEVVCDGRRVPGVEVVS